MTDNRSPMRVFVIFVAFVVFVPPPWRVSPRAQQPAQAQQPTEAQQKPVFRGGTHFVRVDAYPMAKDGRIIEGLKPEDFEITEDGKPQAIESFDYISFPTFTPDVERRDPESQQAGFDLAADPRYRVFVIMVDMVYGRSHAGPVENTDLYHIQHPLVAFLDRVLGPQDLYGFLTSRNTAKDLVLGQKTGSVEAQIMDLMRSSAIDRDDADDLDRCGCGQASPRACDALLEQLKALSRLDGTYTALESLVAQLGSLREERKNIIFVSNSIPRTRPNPSLLKARGPTFPKAGISHGRVGIGDQSDTTLGGANETACAGEFQRLVNIDFDTRYFELIDSAKRANVTFYVVTPKGLTAGLTDPNLIALADNTDGLAIVNTNDLTRGMQKIADDLAAYYVLGYYTTNTTWNGAIRTIKVKLKSSGQTIRARRQYRAPTEAEIAALAKPPAAAKPQTAATSGPFVLVGEPAAYRVAPRQPPERSARLEFTRTDRLRVEFPVLSALDRRGARMLDRTGKPLPIDVPLAENEAARTIVVELPLAPFARGVYSIELNVGAGGKTEQRRLTFAIR